MTHPNMEADKMLDVYIHNYLVKRKFDVSAKTFQAEADLSTDLTVIDAPGGFLFEWWSIFWDIFIARYKRQGSSTAESYNEAQITKTREEEHSQQWHQNPRRKRVQHMHIQQTIRPKYLQQHERQWQQLQKRQGTETQHQNGNGNDTLEGQNPEIMTASAMKMYQEHIKLIAQKEPLVDAAMTLMYRENVGQLLDPNHASILKRVAGGLPTGQTSHSAPESTSRNFHLIKNQNLQLPMSAHEMKGLMRPMLNGPDESLIGVPGPNQHVNNFPLKRWPLMSQRQLMIPEQQNLASSSTCDLEGKKLRMLLDNENMAFRKDDQSNSGGDMAPNNGLQLQVGYPILSQGDADMLIKLHQQQLQTTHPHWQQYPERSLVNQHSQNSNYMFHREDKMICTDSITVDACLSNASCGNDLVSKNLIAQKRKRPMLSPGPANSSGTANTTGPSPSSAPSTPTTHTTGDIISIPLLQYDDHSSKPYTLGSDGMGTRSSASNQLGDVNRFVDNGSFDDNVESLLSNDETDPENTISRCHDRSKDFTIVEIGSIHASAVDCCDFSLDGKLLGTGGHDKKAILWCTGSREQKSTLEEHSNAITDIRFGPRMTQLATSSLDKTVRIWDIENPNYSLQTFMGHSASVMSLDFHPSKEDLICSCDEVESIRYWSTKTGGCAGVSKVGAIKVRFQPSLGRFLAAVLQKGVSIIDVETMQHCTHLLKGHLLNTQSVCWNSSGEYITSVSEDLVRVWKIGSGGEQNCVHKLSIAGKKFHCCIFHPRYPSWLVIGCCESLELWNMAENKVMTVLREPIASLAASQITGLVASASHDYAIKLWK